MYKIPFDSQPKHGTPDTESNSIVLTKENFLNLPELHSADIFNENCEYCKGFFFEQVRHSEQSFPALWIYNKDWKLKDASPLSGGYLDDEIKWVFVCLDIKEDIWIAFEYYDRATLEDAYGSTVGVSFPSHGNIHRLDDNAKEILRRFYP